MPDILVRGMEMPQSCADCPFEVFGDCYGGKVKRIMDIEDYMDRGERHPDCPLLELPPHGDLIDRDELNKCRKESCHGKNGWEYDYVEDRDIDAATAVVPAERSE